MYFAVLFKMRMHKCNNNKQQNGGEVLSST